MHMDSSGYMCIQTSPKVCFVPASAQILILSLIFSKIKGDRDRVPSIVNLSYSVPPKFPEPPGVSMSEHPFGGHKEYGPTTLSTTHDGFCTFIPFTSENLEVFSLRNYLILDKAVHHETITQI